MEKKVVVITGSTDHIGKATALMFAKNGYRVVLNSRSSVDKGQELAKEIVANGGECSYYQADLSDQTACDKLIEFAVQTYSRIDVLINNAGSGGGEPFLNSTKEGWLKMMEDNLFSAVFCSRAAAKVMLEQKQGKIINTSSVRGLEATGREGLMAYSAAKAAIINFTKTLAKELAPFILVNAVAPGFVFTKNYAKMSPELTQNFIDNTLIKRFINPEEIAEAHLFIASSNAMTGEIVVIDGGFTLKLG